MYVTVMSWCPYLNRQNSLSEDWVAPPSLQSDGDQCTLFSLCEYFANRCVSDLNCSLLACVCVCGSERETKSRRRWQAVSCGSNQTLCDPLSVLSPWWEMEKGGDCVRAAGQTDSTGLRRVGVPAGCSSARRVWRWHRSRSPGETACWWKCTKDRPTPSAASWKKLKYFRFVRRETKLLSLLRPWSIQNTAWLRYLHLIGLGVIVQLQLLQIKDVFDVSCFVIPSTCFC